MLHGVSAGTLTPQRGPAWLLAIGGEEIPSGEVTLVLDLDGRGVDGLASTPALRVHRPSLLADSQQVPPLWRGQTAPTFPASVWKRGHSEPAGRTCLQALPRAPTCAHGVVGLPGCRVQVCGRALICPH